MQRGAVAETLGEIFDADGNHEGGRASKRADRKWQTRSACGVLIGFPR
jgi:hypothetical protein